MRATLSLLATLTAYWCLIGSMQAV